MTQTTPHNGPGTVVIPPQKNLAVIYCARINYVEWTCGLISTNNFSGFSIVHSSTVGSQSHHSRWEKVVRHLLMPLSRRSWTIPV